MDYCNFQGARYISLEKHITINVHEFVAKLGHLDIPLTGLYILLSYILRKENQRDRKPQAGSLQVEGDKHLKLSFTA